MCVYPEREQSLRLWPPSPSQDRGPRTVFFGRKVTERNMRGHLPYRSLRKFVYVLPRCALALLTPEFSTARNQQFQETQQALMK